MLIRTLSSTLLAFALYATLRPINRPLAQLALIFSRNDSFLALIVRMGGFARMHLYVSAQTTGVGPVAAQPLVDLMRTIGSTTENSVAFVLASAQPCSFYLFFKSRYIPRFLPTLGVCASVIWTGLYLANLIFPKDPRMVPVHLFPTAGHS